jgi:hypothetical protein
VGLHHSPASSLEAFGFRQAGASGHVPKWEIPSGLTGASEPVLRVLSQATRAPHERHSWVVIRADGVIAHGGHSHVSPLATTYLFMAPVIPAALLHSMRPRTEAGSACLRV